MNDPITKLRQQLQQLKSRHDSGSLDTAAYEAAKAPLERQLLELVMKDPAAAAGTGSTPAPARPSWNLVGLLTVVVFIVAGGGYMLTGSPGLPSAGEPGAQTEANADPHSMDEAQFAQAVDQLAERLKTEPANAEGWAILARSYVRLNRHADAVPAFQKAAELAPEDARLLADYADALAMKNERNLAGEPTKLIERALKIDPDNAKALALAGTAAFNRKDYPNAVTHWEHLAKVTPADAPFMPQLQSSLDEARSLGGMPPGPRLAQISAATAETAAPAASGAAASATTVTGTVSLAPALAKQTSPDDVVFIYARPAEGSRMPLAILRHQVKDLPLQFRLDDNMAMSPAAKMSLFPKIVISARISRGGQATQAAGDLTGESAPVANNASGVTVEIKDVVAK